MIEDGLRPDAVTLLSVLAGCDHSGLIDVGRSIYKSMKAVYGVEPDQRHYFCMVSLLGRAGLVEEAVSLAEAAPERNSPAMWSSLLQSCRLHGNEDVGRRVADILLKLKPRNPAICFQVSEFHSEITNKNGPPSVREAIGVYGSRKEIGHSLIRWPDRNTGDIKTGGDKLLLEIMPCQSGGGSENVEGAYDDIELWSDSEIREEGQEFQVEAALDLEMSSCREEEEEEMGKTIFNVGDFGAVGDGVSDDTQAFLDGWAKACTTRDAVFLVPDKRRYLIRTARFQGPCERNLVIQISGTIVAPDEPDSWDPDNPRLWLLLSKLKGASIQGGGVLDGSGSKWWESSCKVNKTNPCRGAPTALTIDSSSSVTVTDLTLQNSQQIHFTVQRSNAIRISNIRVQAPENSPNTDGIHIADSTNVVIQDCQIGTGDDCISIVSASSNIKMKNIACGPGHGISIGSLGKDNSTATVSGIVLNGATITGTTNGLRIKTWQGGSGFARAFHFENVRMIDVYNPIIIDQFYCDSPTTCQNQTSAVKISQIIYKNISGTSQTPNAIKFVCSNTVPCRNIVLNNINIQSTTGTAAETLCNCATGFSYGFVQPYADCLHASNSHCEGGQISNLQQIHHLDCIEL